MYLQTPPRKKKSLWQRINPLEFGMAAVGAATIELAVDGILLRAAISIVVGSFVCFSIIATQTDWLSDRKLEQFIQREGVMPVIGLAVIVGLCLTFLLNPEPANAQFFLQAENSLINAVAQFTGGETAAGGAAGITAIIRLVMFALRLLLVVYLGVSLVKVVGAARENEDWKDMIKSPILILFCLIIGDQVSQLILGGGGAAPAP